MHKYFCPTLLLLFVNLQKFLAVKRFGRTLKYTDFRSHVEEKQRDILQRIQGISKVDQVGLSQEFFFKLIDSMDAQRF